MAGNIFDKVVSEVDLLEMELGLGNLISPDVELPKEELAFHKPKEAWGISENKVDTAVLLDLDNANTLGKDHRSGSKTISVPPLNQSLNGIVTINSNDEQMENKPDKNIRMETSGLLSAVQDHFREIPIIKETEEVFERLGTIKDMQIPLEKQTTPVDRQVAWNDSQPLTENVDAKDNVFHQVFPRDKKSLEGPAQYGEGVITKTISPVGFGPQKELKEKIPLPSVYTSTVSPRSSAPHDHVSKSQEGPAWYVEGVITKTIPPVGFGPQKELKEKIPLPSVYTATVSPRSSDPHDHVSKRMNVAGASSNACTEQNMAALIKKNDKPGLPQRGFVSSAANIASDRTQLPSSQGMQGFDDTAPFPHYPGMANNQDIVHSGKIPERHFQKPFPIPSVYLGKAQPHPVTLGASAPPNTLLDTDLEHNFGIPQTLVVSQAYPQNSHAVIPSMAMNPSLEKTVSRPGHDNPEIQRVVNYSDDTTNDDYEKILSRQQLHNAQTVPANQQIADRFLQADLEGVVTLPNSTLTQELSSGNKRLQQLYGHGAIPLSGPFIRQNPDNENALHRINMMQGQQNPVQNGNQFNEMPYHQRDAIFMRIHLHIEDLCERQASDKEKLDVVQKLLQICDPMYEKYRVLPFIEVLTDNQELLGKALLPLALDAFEKYAVNLLKPVKERPTTWRFIQLSKEVIRQRLEHINGVASILELIAYSKQVTDVHGDIIGLEFVDKDFNGTKVRQLAADFCIAKFEIEAIEKRYHPNMKYLYLPGKSPLPYQEPRHSDARMQENLAYGEVNNRDAQLDYVDNIPGTHSIEMRTYEDLPLDFKQLPQRQRNDNYAGHHAVKRELGIYHDPMLMRSSENNAHSNVGNIVGVQRETYQMPVPIPGEYVRTSSHGMRQPVPQNVFRRPDGTTWVLHGNLPSPGAAQVLSENTRMPSGIQPNVVQGQFYQEPSQLIHRNQSNPLLPGKNQQATYQAYNNAYGRFPATSYPREQEARPGVIGQPVESGITPRPGSPFSPPCVSQIPRTQPQVTVEQNRPVVNEATDNDEEWSCRHCTFLNPMTTTVCEMCHKTSWVKEESPKKTNLGEDKRQNQSARSSLDPAVPRYDQATPLGFGRPKENIPHSAFHTQQLMGSLAADIHSLRLHEQVQNRFPHNVPYSGEPRLRMPSAYEPGFPTVAQRFSGPAPISPDVITYQKQKTQQDICQQIVRTNQQRNSQTQSSEDKILQQIKKKQDALKKQGEDLVTQLREVENSNYSLDWYNIAATCLPGKILTWYNELWPEAITDLIELFAEDAKELGPLSKDEAEEAFFVSEGVLEEAFEFAKNERENRAVEVDPDGKYNKDDVFDALFKNHGNVEEARIDMELKELAPYTERIWHFEGTLMSKFFERLRDTTLDLETRARLVLAEYETTWGRAEMAVKLIDQTNHSVDDCIEAAISCGRLQMAKRYLEHECCICYTAMSIRYLTTNLNCQCLLCYDCLIAYLAITIKEKHIRHLTCPFCQLPDFSDEIVMVEYFNNIGTLIHNLVRHGKLDMSIEEIFETKVRDLTLKKDPKFRWCAHCPENGFIWDDPQSVKMICHKCLHSTCFQCHEKWLPQHAGISCEQFREWKQANDPEYLREQASNLASQLARHGIRCPECNFTYDLARGGCMHFRCLQCGFEFCSGCSQAFRNGAQCNVHDSCQFKGLHAHHPRDCLYYMRDRSTEEIKRLLKDNDIAFDTEGPGNEENNGGNLCHVMEQHETENGMKDEECGAEVPEGNAGLCEKHYKEYLIKLANDNGVDPIVLMDLNDVQSLLRRSFFTIPAKEKGESDDVFLERLKEFTKTNLPLPARHKQPLNKQNLAQGPAVVQQNVNEAAEDTSSSDSEDEDQPRPDEPDEL